MDTKRISAPDKRLIIEDFLRFAKDAYDSELYAADHYKETFKDVDQKEIIDHYIDFMQFAESGN